MVSIGIPIQPAFQHDPPLLTIEIRLHTRCVVLPLHVHTDRLSHVVLVPVIASASAIQKEKNPGPRVFSGR